MKYSGFEFGVPTRVMFGWGEIRSVGKVVKEYGKKALIVADPFLKDTVAEEVRSELQKNGIESIIFSDVVPNPPSEKIDAGAALAKDSKCEVIVGIGGGSALDTAKGIAVVAGSGGSSWDYVFRSDHEVHTPAKSTLPIIAIPTTAGTGSEVTRYAVITNTKLKEKSTIIHPRIFPKVAVVDPSLTVTMSPHLTATTGFDAFAHAVEAFISKKSNPYSNLVAIEAIRLLVKNLPVAVADGENAEARIKVAYSATLAGIAISHAGTALPHAIGQAIGGRYNAPHGATLAGCFLEVMKRTFIAAPEKFADLLEAMGEKAPEMSIRMKAEKAVEIIERFVNDIGLRDIKFSRYGMKKEDIDNIVESIFKGYKQDVDVHPKKFTREELKELLENTL
ncbi:MAG: iron-containing alcohol dehydrogenase [Candidatus Atribacteria bacterium]|nr:iron-containing alcohol dehydrogenase [Candidatus Atribacteria bacterium]MCD6349213.1 iron-containing alcohol dehydrogenase [Candidatus Atribacteria bacterium]